MQMHVHSPWHRARTHALLVAALAPAPALAHPGFSDSVGFLHGFAHPFSGIDHLLVMFGVGLLAWLLGGKARWRLPLTFLGIMALSSALAVSRVPEPWVESAIALSVLCTGAMLIHGRALSWPLTLPLVALFAAAHGYAHGSAIPVEADGLSFGVGFMIATALLHGTGLLAGGTLALFGQAHAPKFGRIAGGVFCVTAIGLLLGAA